MKLRVLDSLYAVLRLGPDDAIPPWALAPGPLISISRTPHELSILCPDERAQGHPDALRNLRAIKVDQKLDFSMTGVLASLAGPLADAGISIFALSTFETDYLLVEAKKLEIALVALSAAGHNV